MPQNHAKLMGWFSMHRWVSGFAALCLLLALLLAPSRPALAEDLHARISTVAADGTLKLTLPAGHAVKAGDTVTVSTDVPGIGRVTLQTRWRVMRVDRNVATAAAIGVVSGLPKPGFEATIATTGPAPAALAGTTDNLLADQRQKAEAGDAKAMLRLGYHYLGTLPLTVAPAKPDPQQALHWLTLAAQRNNADAACALADVYRKKNDIVHALRFTRQAAERGSAACQYALGVALLNGDGVTKNPAKAFKWIDKAALAGLMPANYQLAKLYLNGIGTKRNVARARSMFVGLAELGVPSAMFYASMLLAPTQPQQAFAWLLKAAKAGHATAMYQVGTSYLQGDKAFKVAKNQPESRRWYEKAARTGEPESMIMLADLMEHGIGGPRNSREAAQWAFMALRGRVLQVEGLLQKPQTWSAAFWRALQIELKRAGAYKGQIDGRFGKATLQAIVAVVKQGS